jgi:hypothetical protein
MVIVVDYYGITIACNGHGGCGKSNISPWKLRKLNDEYIDKELSTSRNEVNHNTDHLAASENASGDAFEPLPNYHVDYIQFPGRGQRPTPVADADSLVGILMTLRATTQDSRDFQRAGVRAIVSSIRELVDGRDLPEGHAGVVFQKPLPRYQWVGGAGPSHIEARHKACENTKEKSETVADRDLNAAKNILLRQMREVFKGRPRSVAYDLQPTVDAADS